MAGPSTSLAGPSTPLAGPSTPLAGPSTPLAGPSTPLAGSLHTSIPTCLPLNIQSLSSVLLANRTTQSTGLSTSNHPTASSSSTTSLASTSGLASDWLAWPISTPLACDLAGLAGGAHSSEMVPQGVPLGLTNGVVCKSLVVLPVVTATGETLIMYKIQKPLPQSDHPCPPSPLPQASPLPQINPPQPQFPNPENLKEFRIPKRHLLATPTSCPITTSAPAPQPRTTPPPLNVEVEGQSLLLQRYRSGQPHSRHQQLNYSVTRESDGRSWQGGDLTSEWV